jgi:serine/threonine-protein kinase
MSTSRFDSDDAVRADACAATAAVGDDANAATATDFGLATLPASLLQGEVARIVASAAFRNSPRHCRFLDYLVTHALRGEGSRLKEMTLGIEVFDRRASTFDPQQDTIVRVEARRLRARLARYYREEGATSLIEIALPIGSYRTVVHRRQSAAGDASLAILPIVDRSDSVLGPALCDDLFDALIDAVVRVPGFKVIARGSARASSRDSAERHAQDGVDVDAEAAAGVRRDDDLETARRLGVVLLIRGALDRDAHALRLKLKLVAADAMQAWAGAWTLPADSDFARRDVLVARVVGDVQRALAERVPKLVSTLAVPGDAMASSGSSASPPIDDRARGLVDRGRYLMLYGTVDAYPQALQRFRDAVAIAPGYAAAHFGIARSLSYLLGMTQISPAQGVEEARCAARAALALDPRHGDAASLLAGIQQRYDHDWPAAQAGYLAAITLAPGALYVHFNYAFGLMFSGRFDAAAAELRLAHDLDPLDIGQRAIHALLEVYRRDYAHAEALLDALLDDQPRHLLAHSLRGALHLFRGDHAAALREYEVTRSLAPDISIGSVGIAQAHALAGDVEAAVAERAALVRAFEGRYLSPYQLALIDLRLERTDEAFAALETSAAERDPNFIAVLVDPSLDALRPDPRFAALIARHGYGAVLPLREDD